MALAPDRAGLAFLADALARPFALERDQAQQALALLANADDLRIGLRPFVIDVHRGSSGDLGAKNTRLPHQDSSRKPEKTSVFVGSNIYSSLFDLQARVLRIAFPPRQTLKHSMFVTQLPSTITSVAGGRGRSRLGRGIPGCCGRGGRRVEAGRRRPRRRGAAPAARQDWSGVSLRCRLDGPAAQGRGDGQSGSL